MIATIDTNVFVSGSLSRSSPPSHIVDMVLSRAIMVAWDYRLIEEYEGVFTRSKLNLSMERVKLLLSQIEDDGIEVICEALPHRLPDATDEKFLEVAIAGSARCLITGNMRHFPASAREGVLVLSPRQFMDMVGREGL